MTDYCDLIAPGRSFALTGPDAERRAPRLPMRGDLAHIALAGQVFVPHYAVPERYVAIRPTKLHKTGSDTAEALDELAAGEGFDVLDIAGGFAWGMAAGGGIGYVATDDLTRGE